MNDPLRSASSAAASSERLRDHLAERGHDVELFERDEVGSGTTAASMAVFVWQAVPPSEFAHRLRRWAWDEYSKFIEDGELAYTQTGLFHVAWSDSTLERYREMRIAPGRGNRRGNLSDAGPYDDDRAVGALYTTEDGHFDPVAIAELYADKAESAGRRFEPGRSQEIETESGRVTGLELADGRIPVDAVVNAAGPWAADVDGMDDLPSDGQRVRSSDSRLPKTRIPKSRSHCSRTTSTSAATRKD